MEPVQIEHSNFTFTKPASMTDEECRSLNVYRGYIDNYPVVISKWTPSQEEIENIKNGGGVYLLIYSHSIPPVSLLGISPFPDNFTPKDDFKL